MSASWTISAAIADLNGDGLAEICDANYVEGEDVATRRCLIEGKPRACSPLNFRKVKGRLLAVDEKGIFRDVSHIDDMSHKGTPFRSGIQQTHTNVPANSHYLAIENHVKLTPILPRTLDNSP